MLGDDDDVFDSITWESPNTTAYDIEENFTAKGPGFRQSTADSEDGRGPHDPKWEGYLITSVKDPVKELAETKDAYVSYLVSAKVRVFQCCISAVCNPIPDQPIDILDINSIITATFSGFCLFTGASCEKLSCMCRPCITGQASTRFVELQHGGARMTNVVVEYITGDRFSPEFMERRRLESVFLQT